MRTAQAGQMAACGASAACGATGSAPHDDHEDVDHEDDDEHHRQDREQPRVANEESQHAVAVSLCKGSTVGEQAREVG